MYIQGIIIILLHNTVEKKHQCSQPFEGAERVDGSMGEWRGGWELRFKLPLGGGMVYLRYF